ncbi:hypothetical protein PQR34_34200 [Paraburkholderia sediminicola]|uniref:hypothetical protein n=1 Tax=Paraburkholderia sediminicola TaxID=458836 RepID=UPI00105FAB9F
MSERLPDRKQGPAKTKKANKKATACRGFHDSNCLRLGAARIRDEASGVPKGAASGDVGVRIGCGSCAKEYDKESAGVNHEFAQIRIKSGFVQVCQLADFDLMNGPIVIRSSHSPRQTAFARSASLVKESA